MRWQWAGLILPVVLAFIAILGVRAILLRMARNQSEIAARWTVALWPVAAILILNAAARSIDNDLNVTGQVLAWFVGGNRLLVLSLAA